MRQIAKKVEMLEFMEGSDVSQLPQEKEKGQGEEVKETCWLVPKKKTYHFAHLFSNKGQVSALCFKRIHPIDLSKRQSWTIRKEAVTCKKCKVLLVKK